MKLLAERRSMDDALCVMRRKTPFLCPERVRALFQKGAFARNASIEWIITHHHCFAVVDCFAARERAIEEGRVGWWFAKESALVGLSSNYCIPKAILTMSNEDEEKKPAALANKELGDEEETSDVELEGLDLDDDGDEDDGDDDGKDVIMTDAAGAAAAPGSPSSKGRGGGEDDPERENKLQEEEAQEMEEARKERMELMAAAREKVPQGASSKMDFLLEQSEVFAHFMAGKLQYILSIFFVLLTRVRQIVFLISISLLLANMHTPLLTFY